MMDAYKTWHSWYVIERWRFTPQHPWDEPILAHRFVQAETLPGFSCGRVEAPALERTRKHLREIWANLNQAVDDELKLGGRCNSYFSLLEDLREFLDEESVDGYRYRLHAEILWSHLERCKGEFQHIRELFKVLSELLRSYAKECELLARHEGRLMDALIGRRQLQRRWA